MKLNDLIEELQKEYGSAERLARVLNVSLQSIFNWKKGKKPSQQHLNEMIKLYNLGGHNENDKQEKS